MPKDRLDAKLLELSDVFLEFLELELSTFSKNS